MKDKDRQLLKDKFSGFNSEFESNYLKQKEYYIPVEQADLAKMLREDNIVYAVGQYKRFYETYSRMNFATNKEKYVKYKPEALSAMIREFFTAY
jgi:exocyst complex protein 7